MTPKEALEVLISNLDQRVLRSLSSSDNYWTIFEEVTEAIKTLEKVTELLGVYRQYYNKIPIGTSMYKVEQQIEKLEKELEKTHE